MEQIVNSVKAKLYDSLSTSFMASFIISMIVINHKYLLVYFSNDADLNKQLSLLTHTHINFENAVLYSIAVALVYTLIFPLFNMILLSITEKQKSISKSIKIKAQGKRAIDKEEANSLRSMIYDLEKESIEKDEHIAKIKQKSKLSENQKDIEINDLKESLNTLGIKNSELDTYNKGYLSEKKDLIDAKQDIEKELSKLEANHIEVEKESNTIKTSYEELKKGQGVAKIEKLRITRERDDLKLANNEINEKYKKLSNLYQAHDIKLKFENEDGLSDNEITLLKSLKNYDSNKQESAFLTYFSNSLPMERVIVDEVLSSLLKEKYLERDSSTYIYLTSKGNKIIIELLNIN